MLRPALRPLAAATAVARLALATILTGTPSPGHPTTADRLIPQAGLPTPTPQHLTDANRFAGPKEAPPLRPAGA